MIEESRLAIFLSRMAGIKMSEVLTVDTSTNSVSISCGTSLTDSQSHSIEQQSSHSENFLTCLDLVLKMRSKTISDITSIGVGIGPGLFTGLRVGIAAAHTFAHALDVPLVYFSSLELALLSSLDQKEITQGELLIAKDTRRHELYFAKFGSKRLTPNEVSVDGIHFTSCLERIVEEELIAPKFFVEQVNELKEGIVVLDDIEKYEEFESIHDEKRRELLGTNIDAKYAIEIVNGSIAAGINIDVLSPQALYIRKSDAELSWGIKS